MTAAVGPHPSRSGALVLALGPLSLRVQVRAVVVTLVLAGLTFAAFAWSISVGEYPVSIRAVLASLAGNGSRSTDFIIRELRLPLALTAVLVGVAFGISGAITQRLARNPLASPDVIGVNAGAAAAATLVIVVLHGSRLQTTVAALAGALATTLAVYLLAYQRGVTGYRLVLVGIGLTEVLGAITSFLLTRAQIFDAQQATIWMTGSLNGRDWQHVRSVGLALVVLVPVAIGLARHLRILELGDDTAKGLGARVELVRGLLLVCAVSLAAVAVASAGPIAFVALVAPQIARRLVDARTIALVPAAVVGALLMVLSDVVGRRIVAPTELPVGIITAVVGAPFLLFLLARANRIGSGG